MCFIEVCVHLYLSSLPSCVLSSISLGSTELSDKSESRGDNHSPAVHRDPLQDGQAVPVPVVLGDSVQYCPGLVNLKDPHQVHIVLSPSHLYLFT